MNVIHKQHNNQVRISPTLSTSDFCIRRFKQVYSNTRALREAIVTVPHHVMRVG